MRLGVHFPHYDLGTSREAAVRTFVRAVEDAGYDYLTIGEHVLGADPTAHERPQHHERPGPYTHDATPYRELFVLLGYLAALTERIELVCSVLVLPQRQTALVAKQAAEVDLLSRGRLVLGVGVGWSRAEFEALGQDFATRGRRC